MNTSANEPTPVDVIFDRNNIAFGVSDDDDQMLRELSWTLNEITVVDTCTGHEVDVRYIAGKWLRL